MHVDEVWIWRSLVVHVWAEHTIGYMVMEIRPQEVPGLKIRNSRECPRSVPERPHDPKGGGVPQRAAEAYVWGKSPSGGEELLLIPFELASKPLTRITNHKLDWVFGASMDVRAWIMSCPTPD